MSTKQSNAKLQNESEFFFYVVDKIWLSVKFTFPLIHSRVWISILERKPWGNQDVSLVKGMLKPDFVNRMMGCFLAP